MTALKPCPFCGGEARFTHVGDSVWVGCSDYLCLGSNLIPSKCTYNAELAKYDFSGHVDTEDEAARQWNQRAEA